MDFLILMELAYQVISNQAEMSPIKLSLVTLVSVAVTKTPID